jgi:hypothetical protein
VLTKAIIQSIDYTKNTCRVRIPLFENASRNINMIEADAQLNIVPGIYNSYKTGDIVFIGFEENKMELPVILGKLFVTASAEASSYRGSVSGNSLAITDTAQLPYSTVFNYDKSLQNSTIYKDLNTPKKLADSIVNLQRSQAQIQKYQTIIQVFIRDNVYRLYLKTSNDFTYTPAKSDEPLYRLFTALKNSQAENMFIPLDLALSESIEGEDTEVVTEEVTEKATIYTTYQALIRIQEFTSSELKFEILLNGNKYEVDKEAILEIQSFAIYY